ncbi:hypothetical protein DFO66_103374 [Brevibacterium sanguinis]|uniref:Uncharacterized protein n=2 Tax=Brevibacterium TaxID=1696 RepID=A0A366INL4_9MICO|nr:hypothetical protein DFO66_103374 [Brevibacterium sanguinis]RBP73076.1 hypothetical protein DFO65_103374 [Brevibacterium celere]
MVTIPEGYIIARTHPPRGIESAALHRAVAHIIRFIRGSSEGGLTQRDVMLAN